MEGFRIRMEESKDGDVTMEEIWMSQWRKVTMSVVGTS